MIKRWAAKLCLVFGGLVFGLLILEFGLRVIGYSFPSFTTTDRHRGTALRPGAEGWFRFEGETYIRINSDGLRDRQHPKSKPSDTRRIAVLGDSYAEALQVPIENAFWSVMERKLQECRTFASQEVEVINFGVSGYGTAQELITLQQHVWDYSPEIVILAVTTGNDITDNSRALKQEEDAPYFIYRNGELVLDESFLDSPQFRLRESRLNRLLRWARIHSRVAQVFYQATRAIEQRGAGGPAREGAGEEAGLDIQVYREPRSQVWNEAWRVTEGLIVGMRSEVREKGAKFLVVTLSNGIQVWPDPAIRQEFAKRWGINNLFYPDERIKAMGEHEGVSVLNLAPAFQAYAEQQKTFLHGFGKNMGGGHWNAEGHRLAGEMIAQRICEGGAK